MYNAYIDTHRGFAMFELTDHELVASGLYGLTYHDTYESALARAEMFSGGDFTIRRIDA